MTEKETKLPQNATMFESILITLMQSKNQKLLEIIKLYDYNKLTREQLLKEIKKELIS
jgi:hypothetical protein